MGVVRLLMRSIISVLTATYNSEKVLEKLANSLINQSDKRFEWIVADGGSSDRTLEILERYKSLISVKIISKKDFGIYDALNNAIDAMSSEYYVVIGSDDYFYENAVSLFINKLDENPNFDIYTGMVTINGELKGVKRGSAHINKQFSYVSAHSVSTLFKKRLHEKFGLYSNKFPIAADHFFILSAIYGDAKVFCFQDAIGCFSKDGVSSQDVLGSLTESYRVQVHFCGKWISTVVFILRLVKNFKRI